ncbi:MAG: hypothetical protein HUK26_06400 [Duodenibacillus sp.]|nr:hypothetical protein [Duodenibacillus sp.]
MDPAIEARFASRDMADPLAVFRQCAAFVTVHCLDNERLLAGETSVDDQSREVVGHARTFAAGLLGADGRSRPRPGWSGAPLAAHLMSRLGGALDRVPGLAAEAGRDPWAVVFYSACLFSSEIFQALGASGGAQLTPWKVYLLAVKWARLMHGVPAFSPAEESLMEEYAALLSGKEMRS